MAWNQPGGDKKDPWGRKNQNNPDLDNIFKEISKFMNSVFKSDNTGSTPPTKKKCEYIGRCNLSSLFVIWNIYSK